MTKVIMRKRAGALVPSESEAVKMLGRIQDGKEVVVDVRQSRDLKQLRRWWQLMKILAANMPCFHADKEQASKMVLMACNEVDWIVNPVTNEASPVPRSIAFENMEEDAFKDLWERAKSYINTEWLPIGTDKLQEEVDAFFSGPQAASLGRRAA